MQFDKKYFDQLYEFFNVNNDVTYNIADLAEDTEKFLMYVRLYQHLRKLDEADVSISFDNTQIRITEFFQNVLNSQNTESLKGQMYVNDLQQVASTPLTQGLVPILSKGTLEEYNRVVGNESPPAQTQVKKSPFDK